MPYTVTGNETELLVTEFRLNAIAPESTATWQRVEGFVRHEDGQIYGVRLAGSAFMRRTHVVLNGR